MPFKNLFVGKIRIGFKHFDRFRSERIITKINKKKSILNRINYEKYGRQHTHLELKR
jgi:hypothetical protein